MSTELINFKEMGKYLEKLQWDKEDLEHIQQFINQISDLSEEKFMEKDFEGLEELRYFIANNNKILIPTIGQYSSGKSSLLNIIIGEEYLPTSPGICTNVAILIEYTSKKNIAELYKIKLKKDKKYIIFEKNNIICNDKTKIKETIDKINKENRTSKLEDSFLLLKVNIELFELYIEKYKEKIILIDFPGLDVLGNKNFFSSDVLSPLIYQSDSFLFFNPEVINSDENQIILIKLIEKIKNRKISFSYQNCLFIMNKWDHHIEQKNNYSLAQAKNDLKDVFHNNQLDDIFNDIDIINCSAKYYNDFKKVKNDILNFEQDILYLKDNFEIGYELDEHEEDENKNILFYNYIIEDIKAKKKKIKEFSNFNLNNENKEYYFEIFEKIIKDNYQFEDTKKDDIIENYLILANNIDNHELFINSNKKLLEMKIIKHILLSIENVKKNIENKGINFIKNIHQTISFVLKKLDNRKNNEMKDSKVEKSEKNKKEIENIFSQFKEIINCEFINYLDKENQNINKYKDEIDQLFIQRKKENENLSNKMILGQIEKEKIVELKENKKKFYDEMKEHFKSTINEVNSIIKTIKMDIKIDENSFEQNYFETTDTTVNVVNKSWYWQKIMGLFKFFGNRNWYEYILN